ncbi:hypothetical protein EV122DRAFT_268157 [Schizophyllum commune]
MTCSLPGPAHAQRIPYYSPLAFLHLACLAPARPPLALHDPPTKPKAPYFIPRRCRARACLRAYRPDFAIAHIDQTCRSAYPAVFLLYLILLSGYGTRSTSMWGGVGWVCVHGLPVSGRWRGWCR